MLLRKLAVINMVLFLSVATCTSVVGQAFVADDIIRINGSQPVISQQMFADLGVSSEGSNINGPSLIRVPDWIALKTARIRPRITICISATILATTFVWLGLPTSQAPGICTIPVPTSCWAIAVSSTMATWI